MRKDNESGKGNNRIDPSRNENKKDNNAGLHMANNNNGPEKTESHIKLNTTANIGWLFYRDYYRGIESMTDDKDKKKELVERNNIITSSEFKSFNKSNESFNKSNEKISDTTLKKNGFSCVEMEVLPPGLLIGSGISHGIPGAEDFQLGFQFDYTTGLPVIPGSSVKGVLRSMFPMKGETEKTDYIKSLLPGWNDDEIKKLGEILFNHEDLATSASPVFFDAIVCRGVDKKQQDRNNVPNNQNEVKDKDKGDILGSDYITPHGKNPLKSPKPIQFMKVLPGVRFKFYFKLPKEIKVDDNSVLRCQLVDLFISILEDVGIGAKTNVGYGHLKRNT